MKRSDAPHAPNLVRRVLIVARRRLLAESLEALFRRESDWEATAAWDLEQALRQTESLQPDVVLLDLALPDGGAFLALRELRACSPRSRLVFLDEALHEGRLLAVCGLRAAGYFTQTDGFTPLLEGLRRVARGQTAYCAAAEVCLAVQRDHNPEGLAGQSPDLRQLTRRELEILLHLARGLSVKECAEQLRLSPNTVDNHKSRLMSKLGFHKSVDLVRLAVREKLLE